MPQLRNYLPLASATNLRGRGVLVRRRMRRVYAPLARLHRWSAVLLGGAPVGRDVLRGVQVRVFRVPARFARKPRPRRAVRSARVPARAALLRGVARVHVGHRDAVQRGLALQHRLLPPEAPRVHPMARVGAKTPRPQSDVRQVFQHQRGATGQRVEQLLGEHLIAPTPKPRPLPRATLQATLGGFGAFGLEAALRTEILSVDLVPVRVAEGRSVRQRGGDDDAAVASDDRLGKSRFGDLRGHGEGEPPAAPRIDRELGGVGAPRRVVAQALVRTDGYLRALAVGSKRDAAAIGGERHGVGVVGDGLACARGARDGLALGGALAGTGHGAHGRALHIADELRLERVGLAQVVVERVVKVDRTFDGGVVEGARGSLVEGSGDAWLESKKSAGLLGRGEHLDLDGARDLHVM